MSEHSVTASLPVCQELLTEIDTGVLRLTLNRPHKRNAMNSQMVDELRSVFAAVENDRAVRAVVIRGADGNFCAGGDISGMRQAVDDDAAATRAAWHFNRNFGHLITTVNRAGAVVVTILEGAVLGGGFGLACVADVAIADAGAQFAMPETGLGIIPAQIAPFVVARIGLTQARRLALLGERIDGEQAQQLGIAHYLSQSGEQTEQILAQVLKRVRCCAPGANAVTKQLMLDVGVVEHEQLLDRAADCFAASLSSDEGREGTQAFLHKRRPRWSQEPES